MGAADAVDRRYAPSPRTIDKLRLPETRRFAANRPEAALLQAVRRARYRAVV